MCALHVATNPAGDTSTLTVAVSDISHAHECIDCDAACSATSDEEHAVSTLMLGPSSPRMYETRPDAIAALPPVAVYGPGSDLLGSEPNSPTWIPTNTPVLLPLRPVLSSPAARRAA